MKQLEFLIVRVRVRRNDAATEGTMTWSSLPAQARAAVVEHVADMLRVHLEQSATVEVDDE